VRGDMPPVRNFALSTMELTIYILQQVSFAEIT
jgi:hypothetical protein